MNENDKIMNADDTVENEEIVDPADILNDSVESDLSENTDENDSDIKPSETNSSTDETEETFDESANKGQKKKGFAIYTSLIIAACILAVSLLTFGVYKIFFDPDIVGAWVFTGDLEAAEESESGHLPYLIFEKDGSMRYSIGTTSYYSPYILETNEGISTVTTNIPLVLSGTFDYDVEGNIFTDCKLTLSYNGSSITFVEMDRDNVHVEVPEEFTPDNEVVGDWYSETQGITYSMRSDGTMKYNYEDPTGVGIDIEGTYSVKDGIITFYYVAENETNVEINYEISENGNILIQGIEYTNISK